MSYPGNELPLEIIQDTHSPNARSESKKRVPYSKKPRDMSLDQWQAGLRKQFASEQNFRITNLGDHPVNSDFEVFNPVTDKTYKVSIRDTSSARLQENSIYRCAG